MPSPCRGLRGQKRLLPDARPSSLEPAPPALRQPICETQGEGRLHSLHLHGGVVAAGSRAFDDAHVGRAPPPIMVQVRDHPNRRRHVGPQLRAPLRGEVSPVGTASSRGKADHASRRDQAALPRPRAHEQRRADDVPRGDAVIERRTHVAEPRCSEADRVLLERRRRLEQAQQNLVLALGRGGAENARRRRRGVARVAASKREQGNIGFQARLLHRDNGVAPP
mmetsp:Transcript_20090/g.57006  ORF Transcript_20090/g.57006 Transcript_20090/m.57006 type:complete len:223 (-) Transcript_20090:1033-1701(-)